MLMTQVGFFCFISNKICSECGEPLEELAESYMMECEHCLAKKDE